MRIGIIGAGTVGGTLGRQWAGRGHVIRFGVRHPENPKLQSLLASIGAKAEAGSVAEAVLFADLIVLSTPWSATLEIIRAAGDLTGKILVDCTNPLAANLAGLSVGHTTSGAELIAQSAHGARVVKAFNSTGAENMLNPQFDSHAATMFICGDDEAAKAVVLTLAGEIGFDAIDAGPLAIARLLEPLAMLWIHLAYKQGLGRDIAFSLLRR